MTVWNRTPGRAGDHNEAATIEEAVEASQLIVVCVLNYEATYAVLPTGSLAGRTVVQLTTGTPSQAREMATWATEHGASYVDGGVMATPPLIGHSGSLVFYSGAKDAFLTSEPALTVLGEARFVGEDPGRAALYDLALLSAMYGMFGGIDHALALGARWPRARATRYRTCYARIDHVLSELVGRKATWLGGFHGSGRRGGAVASTPCR